MSVGSGTSQTGGAVFISVSKLRHYFIYVF